MKNLLALLVAIFALDISIFCKMKNSKKPEISHQKVESYLPLNEPPKKPMTEVQVIPPIPPITEKSQPPLPPKKHEPINRDLSPQPLPNCPPQRR